MSDVDDLLGLLDDDNDIPQSSKRPASPRNEAPAKKRRKARAGSDSDMDMSDASSDLETPSSPPRRGAAPPDRKEVDFASDEEEESSEGESPEVLYSFRGLYKDREDYRALQEKSEIEREAILGERQEEVQAFKDRQKLKQMVAQRDAAVEGGRGERKKTQTGRTEAKASALEKLKKTRKSKAARATAADDDDEYGVKTRRRKPTGYSDDDYSSDEEVTTKGRKKKEPKYIERAERHHIQQLMLPRWRYVRTWHMPWFEEFIKGTWVLVSIGPNDKGELQYRICEVVGVGSRADRPYYTETETLDAQLLLKHGQTVRLFTIDQISALEDEKYEARADDRKFDNSQWLRFRQVLDGEDLQLPTLKDVETKLAAIDKFTHLDHNEDDLAHSIKKKRELRARHGPYLRRAELQGLRHEAKKNKQWEEVAKLDEQLKDIGQECAAWQLAMRKKAAVEAQGGDSTDEAPIHISPAKSSATRDALATVNERNRQINRQAIRKAELAGRATVKREAAVLDPSARVKTTVRLMHDVSASGSQNASRATSPSASAGPALLSTAAAKENGATGTGPGVRLEQAIASKVQVDLDDF